MTLEEIQALEAGPDLNALVAEKVMGLPGVGYYKRKSCHSIEWVPCAKGDHTEDFPKWVADVPYYLPGADRYDIEDTLFLFVGPRAIPLYSTDIAAAWEVVEHIRALPPGEQLGAFRLNETRSGWRVGWPAAESSAPTVPLAICRAALAAFTTQETT